MRLGNFAISRFRIQMRRQLSVTNLRSDDAPRQTLSPDDAWHLFETYAAISETREGKRYKDWIFDRLHRMTGPPLDAVQSGATSIVRSAVRTYLHDEYAHRTSVSFDQPVGDGTMTLGDLLPGTATPTDSIAEAEYDRLAESTARDLFESLSRRECVGLLAKYSGIAIDSPDVLGAAGCGKSSLHQAVRDLLHSLRGRLTRAHGEDGPDSVRAFGLLVVRHLEKCIFEWKASENDLPSCFY